MKTMNKLMSFFGVIALTLVMASCSKDEECNCGIIVSDGITGDCSWLDIRNDCTNNTKRFCFDEYTWANNYVGDNFCVTNESQW
jgi:hypothetical protein